VEKKELTGLARDINWDIVLFMLSIFPVVKGLETAGVTNLLASALVATSKLPSVLGVFAPNMALTAGASFMNNWPTTILGLLNIKEQQ
jgi:Na+/H+ antiporter NhaD/arsenite permease-like protein